MDRNASFVLLVIGLAVLLGGAWFALTSGGDPADVPPEKDGAYRGPEGEDISDWHPGHEPMDPVPPPEVEPEPAAETLPPEPVPDKPAAPAVADAAAVAKMKTRLENSVFSLKADDLDLSAAFGLIAGLIGVEINTNLVDADRLAEKVNFAFAETNPLEAIEFICQIKGLSYEIDSRGIVIK